MTLWEPPVGLGAANSAKDSAQSLWLSKSHPNRRAGDAVMDRKRRPLLAVIGDASVAEDDRYVAARALGRSAVDANFSVVTGGCGGDGGSQPGCPRVGTLPRGRCDRLASPDDAKANPWVDIALPTAWGIARPGSGGRGGGGGGAGTLNEMTLP